MERKAHVFSTRVYRDCTVFLDDIIDVVPYFPKEFKHTVGARMQELAVDQLLALSDAYHARDRQSRADALGRMMRVHDVLRTLMRVAGDRQWIKGVKRCAKMMELADTIERQSSAWRKSVLNAREETDTPPEPGGHD